MKRIAILQSNYIPWKGYFDIIANVDEFILYDEVQYTKNDWRNRNQIKTPSGNHWLTIPVRQESLEQKINDTKISDPRWNKKHWHSICQNYSKAREFKNIKDFFEFLYMEENSLYLSEINYKFITAINDFIGIKSKITWSNSYNKIEGRSQSQRLIDICRSAKADIYLSGPSAKKYLDVSLFEKENLIVEWMDYGGYPEYDQLFSPFEHGVTIIDLLFNTGKNAKNYMKYVK